MLKLSISGFGDVELQNVVLDFNGTIAIDGKIIEGVKQSFEAIKSMGLEIYVVTADIHGNVKEALKDFDCSLHIIGKEQQAQQKLSFIEGKGIENTVAIGNGANDMLMLNKARIGIAITGEEGCNTNAVSNADIIVTDINRALGLILTPKRLEATLKS